MLTGDWMYRARGISLAALIVAAGCRMSPSGPAPAAAPNEISWGSNAPLRAFIDSMTDAPQFSNAHWGILIVDPATGDTLYSRNAGKLFMPASNMKLPTTATALTLLGPEYRYRTTFAARGIVAGGTLAGDLLVIGRGDPSVSDHMLGDAMLPLRLIADSLAARGITRISGRVLPWGNAFPGEVFGYGWTYDDFQDSYSAPIDELLFNEGFSELHLRGGARAGDPVQAVLGPARSFPRVRLSVTTAAPAPHDSAGRRVRNTISARKDSTTWEEIVTGQIAAGDTATIELVHHDPDQAYVAAFREALQDRGITVADGASDTLASVTPLATLTSPPLSDILRALLKPSQNQIAETLFRTIALEKYGAGREDSAAVAVRAQLQQWGASPSEMVVRDGSGLSRYDYISPRALVHILDAMHRSPNFRVYYDALPIAGVDGTIRNRMKGTPAENNVHAKTGSVALSRSLSGYVTTADQHLLIFSFLSNNWTVPVREVERVQDAVAA
jgi:serine-type D-Ala-D-Ala carboxypeptidase/endopeptidase (penicillin-binding protein 4)